MPLKWWPASCTRSPRGLHAAAAAARPQRVQLPHSHDSTVFQPPQLDISSFISGQVPAPLQAQQVQECMSTVGFLAVTGHGISDTQLQRLFYAAKSFFDLPLEAKSQLVVDNMQRGRGYEISPEHKQYMQHYAQFHRQQPQQQQQQGQSYTEPSAAAGILSERFCCGPPLTVTQLQEPYYSSELGQVFFTPEVWPTALVPELQPAMQQCYQQCEVISAAVLRLFAVALGVPCGFFDNMTHRHHSNMQVANYPSQLIPPGPADLRKKAHVDSGTLTLLASQDWAAGSTWQPGDGGLQLLDSQGQWVEVQVPPGALLLNLGSLMTRWTNGLWKSTLHRVTNPSPHTAHSSRRLSVAFFHKPNYDTVLEVLPSCYQSRIQQQQQQGLENEGNKDRVVDWRQKHQQQDLLPSDPLFPPVLVGDVTRQGILHKYRHLPTEEASRRYHEELLVLRHKEPPW